jgi:hypothetical protein
VKTSSLIRLLPLGLLPLAAACGGDARAAGGPVVRDSAGVQIVENTAPAWRDGEGWTVAAEPTVDIGVADGAPEYQFGQVAGAVRLSDGRIVVADGQAKHLRFFDGAGVHLRTVGRNGGGPGEFQSLSRVLRLRGDTVGAWDSRSDRFSVFDPRGEFVRARTLRAGEGRILSQADGAFADGSLLMSPFMSLSFRPGTQVSRDTFALLRYPADRDAADTLGRFAGSQVVSVVGPEDGGWAVRSTVPFGPETFRTPRGDLVYVADSERFAVAVYGTDGTLRRVLRAAREPEALTPEEVARYKEEQLGRTEAGEDRAMTERLLAATPFPQTKSAFTAMVVDAEGAVWLREHATSEDGPGRWTVFDTEGALLGTVETPAGVRVLEIGGDYLLGVWADDLDVQHVRLYRLDKSGAGNP